MITDLALLQAALVGFQSEREKVLSAIADLEARLGQTHRGTAATPKTTHHRRRPLSSAARKRIAAAQRKRWADWKKAKKR
jgi:hypothetical protein